MNSQVMSVQQELETQTDLSDLGNTVWGWKDKTRNRECRGGMHKLEMKEYL